MNATKRIIIALFALPLLVNTLTACSSGNGSSSGSSSGTGATATRDAVNGVSVLTFQAARYAQWLMDSSGRAYTSSRTLHFTGSCGRGISSILVVDQRTGATIGPAAACLSDNSYVWAGPVTRDGNFEITFKPQVASGVAPTTTLTVPVAVDTSTPPSPVITTHGGANFSSTSPNVDLQGTVATSVTRLTVTGGGQLTYASGDTTFDNAFTLQRGQSITLSFTAYNFVGTPSIPTRITVSYNAGHTLKFSQFSGAGSNGILVSTNGRYRLANLNLLPVSLRTERAH